MDVERCSPEAAYLTKPNIVAPVTAAQATAMEAAARLEIAQRKGSVTVTGGTIKR
jgi:hypothetical protein